MIQDYSSRGFSGINTLQYNERLPENILKLTPRLAMFLLLLSRYFWIGLEQDGDVTSGKVRPSLNKDVALQYYFTIG